MSDLLKAIAKSIARVLFVVVIWIGIVGTGMVLITYNAAINPNQLIMIEYNTDGRTTTPP